MLFNSTRGLDSQPLRLVQPRKSVGTQISWGVRYETDEQMKAFLSDMAAEVSKRMQAANVKGENISLRIKRHASGNVESEKMLNPGQVEIMSKSRKIAWPTDCPEALSREVVELYQSMHIPSREVRGAGIAVDHLVDNATQNSKGTHCPSLFIGEFTGGRCNTHRHVGQETVTAAEATTIAGTAVVTTSTVSTATGTAAVAGATIASAVVATPTVSAAAGATTPTASATTRAAGKTDKAGRTQDCNAGEGHQQKRQPQESGRQQKAQEHESRACPEEAEAADHGLLRHDEEIVKVVLVLKTDKL
eukprot:TRINITY_DN1978_c0_g1_i6.p1 TRINITY_DN1978_c0_g1~~TRINITY_DN1978_c0_g1_i6.p1  ORF type:complete len:356 (+),score=50.16 TRINITY_DN1978_c0_g1_i6:158-1069(+)